MGVAFAHGSLLILNILHLLSFVSGFLDSIVVVIGSENAVAYPRCVNESTELIEVAAEVY